MSISSLLKRFGLTVLCILVLGHNSLISSMLSGKNSALSYVYFILPPSGWANITEGHGPSQCEHGVLVYSKCRQWRRRGRRSICRSDCQLHINCDKCWECHNLFVTCPSKSLNKSPICGGGRKYLCLFVHAFILNSQFLSQSSWGIWCIKHVA